MKAVKIILVILAAIFAIWLIASALSPSHCHLERSVEINAPASVVFDNVHNLKKWQQWSYWNELEPDARKTYEGPESGVGSKYSWEGKKTGKGSMTIIESVPNETIKTELDFDGKGTAKAGFKFELAGNGTKVTWNFDSDVGFMQRVFMALVMDKFLGTAYEKGLAKLKTVCESAPVAPASAIEEVDITPQWVITMRDTTDLASISSKIGAAYQHIMGYVMTNGITPAGQPVAFWYDFNREANSVVMEPGIPVSDSVAVGKGMKLVQMSGKAIKITKMGPYHELQPAYDALQAYMQQKGLSPRGAPWEVYVTDPMQVKDTAQWQTDIYYPI